MYNILASLWNAQRRNAGWFYHKSFLTFTFLSAHSCKKYLGKRDLRIFIYKGYLNASFRSGRNRRYKGIMHCCLLHIWQHFALICA